MRGLFDNHRPLSVTICPRGSKHPSGTWAFDAPEVDTVAWVTDRTGLLRKTNGREIQFSRIFYLDKKELVAVGDRIRYLDKNHEVISVSVARDINGKVDHKKVLTGDAFSPQSMAR